MKEVTRVITARITVIEKNVKDSTELKNNEEVAKSIKKMLRADDVQVTGIKDFEFEKPGRKRNKKSEN